MRRPHRGLRYGPAILPTACGMAKNRPAQAIEYFAAQGVAVKEFSEDSPLTVPLLPPGSACLTPADRSTRETCPRIPTSSAACWKSTLSRTSAHAVARADRLAVARLKSRTPGPASPQWPSPRRPLLHAAHSARVVQTGSQGRLEDNHGRKNESGWPKAAVESRARATSEADANEVPHARGPAVPYAALDPVLARPRGHRGRPGSGGAATSSQKRAICAPKPALMVSQHRAPIRRSGPRDWPRTTSAALGPTTTADC